MNLVQMYAECPSAATAVELLGQRAARFADDPMTLNPRPHAAVKATLPQLRKVWQAVQAGGEWVEALRAWAVAVQPFDGFLAREVDFLLRTWA